MIHNWLMVTFTMTQAYDLMGKVNGTASKECLNYPMWPIKIDSSGDEAIDDYGEVIARIRQAIVEKIDWLDDNIP